VITLTSHCRQPLSPGVVCIWAGEARSRITITQEHPHTLVLVQPGSPRMRRKPLACTHSPTASALPEEAKQSLRISTG